MNLKKKLITGAVITSIGLSGAMSQTDMGKKIFDCVGRDVQIETMIQGETLYLCGNQQFYNNAKGEVKTKLRDNKMQTEHTVDGKQIASDFVVSVLIARNDIQFYNDTRDIMIAKYDSDKKTFDGSKLDSDFLEQMAFYVELANIKCNGNCGKLDMKNLDEAIYNLIK